MADVNLKILITATNEVKAVLEDIRKDFAATREALAAISAGNTDKVVAGLAGIQQAAEGATNAVKKHEEAHAKEQATLAHSLEGFRKLTEGLTKLAEAVRFVTGGFLAFEAIHMVKEVLDVAARTETLGVVLKVVGANAGYTAGELDKTDRAVQKLGITAESSRQSLTQLIQSGISLNLAQPLARAAQDLAVITGIDSSQTFARLVTNIQQMDTLGLRFMGIMVDREQALQEAAALTGKTITTTMQKEVLANAVLTEAAKLAGTYEAAMSSVGKQLTSFPRYVEEFKDALGSLGQEAYYALVVGARDVIEAMTELLNSFREVDPNAALFGESVGGAASQTKGLAGAIRDLSKAIVDMIHWVEHNKAVFKELWAILSDVVVVLLAIKAASVIGSLATMAGEAVALTGAAAGLTGALTVATVAFRAFWASAFGPIGLIAAGLFALYEIWDHNKNKPKEAADGQADVNAQVEKYINLQNDAIAKQLKLLEVADQLKKARLEQITANSPEAKDAATSRVDQITAKQKALQKELTSIDQSISDIQSNLKENHIKLTGDAAKAVEDASKRRADVQKQITDVIKFKTDLEAALKGVGLSYTDFTSGVSDQTSQMLSNLDTIMSAIGKLPVSVQDMSTLALRALENMVAHIKTPQELEKFQSELDATQKRFEKFGINLSGPLNAMVEQATQNVTKATAAMQFGGEQALQQLERAARRHALLVQQQVRNESEVRKAEAAVQTEIDKAQFDSGLITLEDYYKRRRVLIESNTAQELQAEVAAIREAQSTLTVQQATGAPKYLIEQTESRLAASMARVQVAAQKGVQERVASELAEAQTRIKLEEQVATIRQKLNTELGFGEAALREKYNSDLRKQLDILSQTGNEEDQELARLAAFVDFETKRLQLVTDRASKERDFYSAQKDLQESQVKLAQARGDITSDEAEVKLNSIISERIELLRKQRDALIEQRDLMEQAGTYGADAMNNVNKAITDTTKQMVDLKGSITAVGKELQNTFVDSFSSNLTAILNHTKSFKQGVKDLFNDLNNQILKTLTKNMAEDAVKALNGMVNKDGKSGGFFDQIMSAITGKPIQKEVPIGSTSSNPMWVQQVGQEPVRSGSKVESLPELTSKIVENTKETASNTAEIAKQLSAKAVADGKKDAQEQIDKHTVKNEAVAMPTTRPGAVPFDFNTAGRNGQPIAVPTFNAEFDLAAVKNGLDKYGLNGDALRAIAQRESNFKADAVSPPNKNGTVDVGVMQINSDNIRKMGLSVDEMKDAGANIQVGAKLFKEEMDKWGGDIEKALAGYNAGDKNVQNAIDKANAPGGSGDFKDYLPSSTQKYVADLAPKMGAAPPAVTIKQAGDSPVPVSLVSGEGGKFSGAGATGDTSGNNTNTATIPQVDVMGNPTGGTQTVTGETNNQTSAFFDTVMPKLQSAAMGAVSTAVPALGPIMALMSELKKDLPNLFRPSVPSFAPNANGVPRTGSYQPFEGDTTDAQQAAADSTKQVTDAWGQSIQSGNENLASGLGSGQFGINGVFNSLSNFFSQMFSGISSALGGGVGVGGGVVDTGTVTGADMSVAFAEGGPVFGPGTGTSDSIPARLSHGEYVINAEATSIWRPLLDLINFGDEVATASLVPRSPFFASGGLVDSLALSGTSGGLGSRHVSVVQHISTPDLNSFKRSQDQLAVEAMRSMNRATRRNT